MRESHYSVAWSPNGRWIACGGGDNRIQIWDIREARVLSTLNASQSGVRSLAWSPDSCLLASGCGTWKSYQRSQVQVWEVAQGTLLWAADELLHGSYTVAFDPSGRWLASGHGSGQVMLWHVHSGQVARTISIGEDIRKLVNGLDFSPDGSYLALGTCYEDELYLYEVEGSLGHCMILPEQESWMNYEHPLRFSPSGEWLARGSQNGEVLLWSAHQMRGSILLDGHDLPTYAIAWSPTGRWLASGSRDGRIKVWDVRTQRAMGTMRQRPLHSICFSPDGYLLASVGDDKSISIWHADPTGSFFGALMKQLGD